MSNQSNNSNLDLLEERLRLIEDKIIGHSNEIKLKQNVIKSLTLINDRLITVCNKDKIINVNNQIDQYDKFINDPSLIDDKFSDDNFVKAEIVLDNEQRIRKQYDMLEKIILKEKIIESKFINDFDTFLPKLKKIRETALKQQEHCNRIKDETKKLLEIYNQLMNVVKNQLSLWESKVLNKEQMKQDEENTIKSLEEFD